MAANERERKGPIAMRRCVLVCFDIHAVILINTLKDKRSRCVSVIAIRMEATIAGLDQRHFVGRRAQMREKERLVVDDSNCSYDIVGAADRIESIVRPSILGQVLKICLQWDSDKGSRYCH